MAKHPVPPLKFLFQDPAHLIACGFGSGLSRFAPGTAGTAFAWACYPLLRPLFPTDLLFLAALAVLFALGVIVCDITGRHLGVTDHGAIVWDEIVPFWLVLALAPAGLGWQLLAFLAFRFFDIVKPPPARWFDTQVKNGFGVMMDDLVAAGYTLLALAALKNVADRLL
ncbi:phosphatidylglycerophosphatase A [Denitratisoma sp. DHT3]|uniref:phosphatidylglycerophosphatase A family protein n=1 Tax=Denitratisoma sp. DHT3 TaxID=1981880 RepID=UPI001645EC28|nr:phosphatidylglycerophosphatase A [Denitratisoma sp. DHT3]